MMLFRGETTWNRDHPTDGMSWSTQCRGVIICQRKASHVSRRERCTEDARASGGDSSVCRVVSESASMCMIFFW